MIKKALVDSYLSKYLSFCKKELGENLIGIIIYGSYIDGEFSREKSDYDIFVILKKEFENEEFIKRTKDKFLKITLQYLETGDALERKVAEGGWAIYIALCHTGKIIYKTPVFIYFLKNLENKIDIKKCLERYSEKRNNEEVNAMLDVDEWYAVKWPFASIRKRIFLISYARFGKSDFDFMKDVDANRDLFSESDIKELKTLKKMYKKRNIIKNIAKRARFIHLMKKINLEIEKLAKQTQ